MISSEHRKRLADILPAFSVIDADSPSFDAHSVPWSLSYDKKPALVLVPRSVQELQSIVQYLYATDLDIAIRGKGTGSSSAHDVIISMSAFDQITGFDQAKSTVDIGAGLDWGDVDTRMATLAPGYVVVGARCPFVGVAGSTLSGGLSWLSHELGLGSDPENMIDAFIVKANGQALWASEEPDLLWALRGGGGNFGVVTTLRFKAHKYESTIFAGMIRYPPSALKTLSERVSTFASTVSDPKMAMHIFIVDFASRALHGGSAEPQLIALIFDAHGEDHGRGTAGFRWALDIEGASTDARVMPLSEVHGLQRASQASHGAAQTWLQAALIQDIDRTLLIRAWDWYVATVRDAPDLALGTFALLEIMQERSLSSAGSPEATAWPHGAKGRQHVLQLSTGGGPSSKDDFPKVQKRALDILKQAPVTISGKAVHPPGTFYRTSYFRTTI